MFRLIKQGADPKDPKDPKDVALEILRKYPHMAGLADIHETAGDHFKQLSRELWEKEGPPTPPHVRREKKAADTKWDAAKELGGLGLIAMGPVDSLQARARARLAKDKSKDAVKRRQLMGEGGHAVADVLGLGVLGKPYVERLVKRGSLDACLDELEKLGESSEISVEDARRSLDRLDTLERNRPTAKQVGRYAALGAVAGPAVGAVSNVIKGKSPLNFSTAEGVSQLRGVLGESAKGALGMGAVPLVRGALDRQGEKKELRKFLEQEYRDHGPDAGATDVKKVAAAEVFNELQELLADPTFLKTASTKEIAELAKVAIEMAALQKNAAPANAMPPPRMGGSMPSFAPMRAPSFQATSPNSMPMSRAPLTPAPTQALGTANTIPASRPGVLAPTMAPTR